MDWFKHSTHSHEDPDINDIWDEFGDSGYVMFFVILEIYGREYNSIDDDGFLWIKLNHVARKCRKSSVKVQKFLRYCEEISRFSLKILKQNPKKIGIKIPKFIEISSNWTKRKTTTPTEAPIEVPTAIEVEEEKKKNKNKTFSQESNEFKLSKFLFKHIQKNNPNAKEPNLQKWSEDFDKIIRIDKRDIEQIKKIITWCQKDSFWMSVVLSPGKLREKYDQLIIKSKSNNDSSTSGNEKTLKYQEDKLKKQDDDNA